MDRHVIKGRGTNRGKYLCWAAMAADVKPTEDGFVWLPEQRKSARWADPRYSWNTWATDRARLHDGYFVKLTTSKAITMCVDDLRSYVAEHADGAGEELACYWIHGAGEKGAREAARALDYTGWNENYIEGEGTDFCGDCADEVIDALRRLLRAKRPTVGTPDEEEDENDCGIIRDGGWDTDHDSPPYCGKCGAKLAGTLTDYGADEEIKALTAYAAPAFDDVAGWASLYNAIVNLSDDDPRWRKIAKVVEAARVAEREDAARKGALAASPGMPEARVELLSLLGARQVQKAPEPSFPFWPELLAWLAMPYEERKSSPDAMALEKRMIVEAKSFARCLGFGARWSDGRLMIKAPYGTYYWPFVVQIEQYRLWRPKAFVEGRAYMLHLCPSGNPEWPHHRDANPYPAASVEHSQWDCGYISTTAQRTAA